MTLRQYFNLYRIFEDYSKKYISFEYTPTFILPTSFCLTEKDIRALLDENGKLIKAMYNRDETTINSILNKPFPPFLEFKFAQISEEDAIYLKIDSKKVSQGLPLPIQARFVLKGWALLREQSSEDEKEKLINILKNDAFNNSFYPQITKMALSFEKEDFKRQAIKALNCSTRSDTFYLFYKVLGYYYRLKKDEVNQENCRIISTSYLNNDIIDEEKIDLLNKDLLIL